MEEYFSGKKIYGDNFSLDEIEKWFEQEKEGYANLGSNDFENYFYGYHNLNKIHAFNHLKKVQKFENVLGFGAAWGHEFIPIIDRIENMHILEPSDQLVSKEIYGKKPIYKHPSISGKIDFSDNYFDLITSFGVLHHIPNITFVISEILRVLKPGGYFIMREPITSMGDWTKQRANGLTKNERGIPVEPFEKLISNLNFQIVSQSYCFTMITFMQKYLGKLTKHPIYYYNFYIKFDKILSNILKFNRTYHATKKLQRVAPQLKVWVLKKEIK